MRPLRARLALLGRNRFLQARRERPSRLCAAHQSTVWARAGPEDGPALREHEPTRRSRRKERRATGSQSFGADRLGFPAATRTGGAVCSGTRRRSRYSTRMPPPEALRSSTAGSARTSPPTRDQWQLGKVMEVSLRRTGSTTTGTARASSPGSSPLPLILLRNGALLIGDWSTGTIYRIGTPTEESVRSPCSLAGSGFFQTVQSARRRRRLAQV